MIATNTKMKKFIAKSSTTCLCIFIALEVVAVILLVVPLWKRILKLYRKIAKLKNKKYTLMIKYKLSVFY